MPSAEDNMCMRGQDVAVADELSNDGKVVLDEIELMDMNVKSSQQYCFSTKLLSTL